MEKRVGCFDCYVIKMRCLSAHQKKFCIVMEPLFEQMEKEFPFITFHHGLPSEENLNSLSDETICNLVVLDDLMKTVTSSGEMANLFVKGMHHRHLSILFLNQNLYCKGKHSRTINFSCSVWHVKRFWEEEDFYLMRIRTRLHKRTDIWS